MRWFKHFSDNHRGQSQQYFLDELGHFGPCGYYFIVEMCAEKLERLSDRELVAADCEFRFHRRVIQSALRAKPAAIERLLNAGTTCNLLTFEMQGDFILIKMPKLLEWLDYDSKKSRPDRAKVAPGKRLEKESEKEKDVEPESELTGGVKKPAPALEVVKPEKPKPNTAGNLIAWESYKAAYIARHKVEPLKNKENNIAIATFVKKVGQDDAPGILAFYVGHNDFLYLKAIHPLNLAVRDADALRTQWMRGQQVTTQKVHAFTKQQDFKQMAADAEEGGF